MYIENRKMVYTMPQKECKRIILEVPEWIHDIVKDQAKVHNVTIRAYVLRLLMPEVSKRKNLLEKEE